jgi:D-alanine-D-alanine ligase
MLDSAFINLLDINADATLHPQRSFAQITRAAGLSYQQLIEVVLKTSLTRWEKVGVETTKYIS